MEPAVRILDEIAGIGAYRAFFVPVGKERAEMLPLPVLPSVQPPYAVARTAVAIEKEEIAPAILHETRIGNRLFVPAGHGQKPQLAKVVDRATRIDERAIMHVARHMDLVVAVDGHDQRIMRVPASEARFQPLAAPFAGAWIIGRDRQIAFGIIISDDEAAIASRG